MSQNIIFDLACFVLGGEEKVLAALYGDSASRIRGVLVRRWKALDMGNTEHILQEACHLAAEIEEGHLVYKPKPAIQAEEFIGTVRMKLEKAALLGAPFAHANHVKIAGFCIRVERDAVPTWKAENLDQAQAFLSLNPVERTPYSKLVFEKMFPPTNSGYELWQRCITKSKFMQSFPTFQGLGEY